MATPESNRATPVHQTGPVNQLGRGQRKAEDSNPSACAPSRIQTGGRALAASPSDAESGGPDPQRLPAHPASNGSAPWRVHFPWRMAQELNLLRTRAPTARFQRGALPVGQPSAAESGAFEAHTRGCALVSSEARSLIGSLSLRTGPRIRTGNLPVLNGAPLPGWASPAWSGYRESDPGFHLGKVVLCH